MEISEVILVLGGLILFPWNVECTILAVKCCLRGEQLSQDLKTCFPINMIKETRIYLLDDSNTSNISQIDSHPYYETVTSHENYDDNFHWLPKHLKNRVGKDSIVAIGRRNNCSDKHTVRLHLKMDKHRFDWLENGSLILRSETVRGNISKHLYKAQEFCADSFTDNNGVQQTAILLCPCDDVLCVRKCCPIGQVIVYSNGVWDCESSDLEWQPFHPNLPLPQTDFPYEIVIDKNVICNAGFVPTDSIFCGYPRYLLQRFWKQYLNGGEMCGDMIVGKIDIPQTGMIRCMRKIPFYKLLDNWLHVPEAVFLGLALITTLIIPRRRLSSYSYVHDLALVCHTLSLLVRSSLWMVYLVSWWRCYIIPVFVYFCSVAASFWLNVLCLNMVCGFWRPLGLLHGRWKGAKGMFLCYSLYAWGASAGMTAFTAFMWFSLEAPAGLLRPTLHETRTCFREEESDGKAATFAYYYGPMGGLLAVNALLFLFAALRVRSLRRHSSVLRSISQGGSASSWGSGGGGGGGGAKPKDGARTSVFRADQSVVIYLKLLWLMGVTEMAVEIVTWASNSHIYYNALIVSCLDVVRSIAIFVFCCCKWRTLRAVRQRLCACAASSLRRWRAQPSEETDLPEIGGEATK